jgi:hypothetical protein
MNPQLNHFMVQHKQCELTHRAEQARLARKTRAPVSAQPRRSNFDRLIAWLGAAGLAASAQPISAGPPQECGRCET